MKLKKIYLIIILLLINLQIVFSLGSLSISIQSNKDSVDLEHNEKTQVTFYISHNNDICSINCEWGLINFNTNEVIDSGVSSISATSSFSKSFNLQAPSKDEGGISGQEKYIFRAECTEITSLTCWTDGSDEEEILFTLNYDLSYQEKNAKEYLDEKLNIDLKEDLSTFEKKLYNLNSKLSELASNVLVNDIKEEWSSLEKSFISLKSYQEQVSEYYDDLNFLSAKNIFQDTWISDSKKDIDETESLESRLTERIELHNSLANNINDLASNLNILSSGSKVFSLENVFDNINQELTDLSSKFERGNFNSYDEVTLSIELIETKINKLNLQISEKQSKFINLVVNQFNTEKESLCKQYQLCSITEVLNENDNLENLLNNFCDLVDKINSKIIAQNQESIKNYNKEKEEIEEKNSEFLTLNSKIRELNNIRKEVYELFNKNDIINQEITDCSLIYLNESITTGEIDSIINKCVALKEEVEESMSEKEKNFFYKIKLFLSNLFKKEKYHYIEIDERSLIALPTKPDEIKYSESFKIFVDEYCSLDLSYNPSSDINVDTAKNPEGEELEETSIMKLKEHKSQCCTFGICRECCEGDDCKTDKSSYPIIFLHGHSFLSWDNPQYSLDAFNKLRDELLGAGVLIGGTVTPQSKQNDVSKGDWGKSGVPVSVKTTYYYDVYDENGKLVNKPSKSDSISTYANRFAEIVDLVKYRTNRDKVIIIAHSMGGLVAREYIRQGNSDSVYKLIMIGTPNHGIYGSVDTFCSLTGSDKECEDMKYDSSFISQLNSGDETIGDTKYYTITGTGCISGGIDGDEIVRSSSVPVEGGRNYEISGMCNPALLDTLHGDLLNPSKYPEVVEKIKIILKE